MLSRRRGRHPSTTHIFRIDRELLTHPSYNSIDSQSKHKTSHCCRRIPRKNGKFWTFAAAVLLFLNLEVNFTEGSRKNINRTEIDLFARFHLQRLPKPSHVTHESKSAIFTTETRVSKHLRRLRLWELLPRQSDSGESDISPLSVVVSLQPENLTRPYYLFAVQDAKKRMQLGVKISPDRVTFTYKGHRTSYSFAANAAGNTTVDSVSTSFTTFAFLFENGSVSFHHKCGEKQEKRLIPAFRMKDIISETNHLKTKIILGRRRRESTAFVGKLCQLTLHQGADAARNYCTYLRKRCRETPRRKQLSRKTSVSGENVTSAETNANSSHGDKDIHANSRDINEDVRWKLDSQISHTSSSADRKSSLPFLPNDSLATVSRTSPYFYQKGFTSRKKFTRTFTAASPRSRRADVTPAYARGRSSVVQFPREFKETDIASSSNIEHSGSPDDVSSTKTIVADAIKTPKSSDVFNDPLLFIADVGTVQTSDKKVAVEISAQLPSPLVTPAVFSTTTQLPPQNIPIVPKPSIGDATTSTPSDNSQMEGEDTTASRLNSHSPVPSNFPVGFQRRGERTTNEIAFDPLWSVQTKTDGYNPTISSITQSPDSLFTVSKLHPGDVTSRDSEHGSGGSTYAKISYEDVTGLAASGGGFLQDTTIPVRAEVTIQPTADEFIEVTTPRTQEDGQYEDKTLKINSTRGIADEVEITIGQVTHKIPSWASTFVLCKNDTEDGNEIYLCGLVGPKGEPGLKGPPGKPGKPGRRGREGMMGMYGPYGMPGLPGDPGPKGEKGHYGEFGRPGLKGEQGQTGDAGMIGPPGMVGMPGDDGFPGNPGQPGFPGASGRPGEQGPPGLPGRQGEPGPNGIIGKPGVEGDPGLDGLLGPPGLPGDYGEIGTMGSSGAKGIAGAEGDAGEVGVPGDDGKPGPPGMAGRMGLQGKRGEVGLRGPQGPPGGSDLKGYPGLQGPTGLKGDKGSRGLQGTRGERGLKGEKGNVGLRGPPGRPGRGGLNGTDGDPGPVGPPGTPGEKGLLGHTGKRGRAGAIGQRGQPGQIGDPGLHGLRGLVGDPGDEGIPGSSGHTGKKGKQGNPGKPGRPGPDGYPGDDGRRGRLGAKGPPGIPGARGEAGFEGPMGDRGEPGKRGIVGEKGPTGHPGIPGLLGPIGVPGPPGASGITGPRGAPGEIGMKGSTGPPGQRGEDGEGGEKGITGNPGPQGSRGETGERGITGDPGLKGYMGEPGEVGPEGEQGTAGYQGEDGPAGIQGDPGAPGEKGVDGKEGKQGSNGEKGPRGDRGPAGLPGIVGREGIPGLPGPPGDPGEDGRIGKKGKPGLPGIDGELGNTGATGDNGPQGPRGLIGYPGLEGLQGKVGPPGLAGLQGEKGEMGEPGYAGVPGSKGMNGKDGVTGLKGIRGDRGPIGVMGEEGNQGPLGPKGFTGPPGNPGHPGFQGKKGLEGPVGEPGPKGIAGQKGKQGSLGDPGDKGKEGDPGLQGERGAPGLRGENGGRGANGHAGPRGAPGNPGERGERGKDGKKGEPGTAGVPGSPGKDGLHGLDGEIGPPGRRGEIGEQGSPGKDGARGPRGSQGDIGFDGPVGKIGDPGYMGFPGPRGEDGKPGPQGPAGEAGIPGPTGPEGAGGAEGPRGPKGLAGDIGPPGEKGVPGFGGVKGPQGQYGHRGDEGPAGTRGARGERGSDGASGEPGPIGLDGPKGVLGPAGFMGSRGEIGLKGRRGEQGIPGRPGPPGPDTFVTRGGGTRSDLPEPEKLVEMNDQSEVVTSRDHETEEEYDHHEYDYGLDISSFGHELQSGLQLSFDALRSHYHPNGVDKNQPATTCQDVAFASTKLSRDGNGNGILENGLYWLDPNEGCKYDAFKARCSFETKTKTCIPSTGFSKEEISSRPESVPNMDRYFRETLASEGSISLEKESSDLPTTYIPTSQARFLHMRSIQAEQIILIQCRDLDIWTKDPVQQSSDRYQIDDISFISWNGKTLHPKQLPSTAQSSYRGKTPSIEIIADKCGRQGESWQGAILRLSCRVPAQLPVTRIIWPKVLDSDRAYIDIGQVCFT